ncbi:hypothetical protein [Caudoviricetes sp.]|nr:hypothetical protein [Caudoviricetes sp.]UOF81892.1 hypothetical protein [Caudoviricetes sp.]
MNKRNILYGLLALLLAVNAFGGSVKTWSAGEFITANDLNAALTHLHTNLGHGHGAVIINSDVSASAGIAHSKLATPALVPKAFGFISCSPSVCSSDEVYGIASTAYTSAGVYVVTLSAVRANTSFTVLVSSVSTASADVACHGWVLTTNTLAIRCITASTGAAVDSNFNIIVMDMDN